LRGMARPVAIHHTVRPDVGGRGPPRPPSGSALLLIRLVRALFLPVVLRGLLVRARGGRSLLEVPAEPLQQGDDGSVRQDLAEEAPFSSGRGLGPGRVESVEAGRGPSLRTGSLLLLERLSHGVRLLGRVEGCQLLDRLPREPGLAREYLGADVAAV